jgi:uncharacterized protein (TIGR02145 family)
MKKFLIIPFIVLSIFSCEKEENEKVDPRLSSEINFESLGPAVSKFGSTISDIEGNSYKTVLIGKQEWMAENLKVSKYNDGSSIPNITDRILWKTTKSNAWAYPIEAIEGEKYNKKFGKLYNWYTVDLKTNGNKNVCPTGWHVPSDAEWTILTDYLGGPSVAGGKMKEVGLTTWNSPNAGATNISLFTSISGGYRADDGVEINVGFGAGYWSTTVYDHDTLNAWFVNLSDTETSATRLGFSKKFGFSIRCLKD